MINEALCIHFYTLRNAAQRPLLSQAQGTPVAPNNTGITSEIVIAPNADQQSNRKSDIELTRSIRHSLEKDPSLSAAAHNIKIISTDGAVVLRGPVNTAREKASIGVGAQNIAGAHKVTDELEVKN